MGTVRSPFLPTRPRGRTHCSPIDDREIRKALLAIDYATPFPPRVVERLVCHRRKKTLPPVRSIASLPPPPPLLLLCISLPILPVLPSISKLADRSFDQISNFAFSFDREKNRVTVLLLIISNSEVYDTNAFLHALLFFNVMSNPFANMK